MKPPSISIRESPTAPSASSRSASCTTFASIERGSIPAEKLCASIACAIPGSPVRLASPLRQQPHGDSAAASRDACARCGESFGSVTQSRSHAPESTISSRAPSLAARPPCVGDDALDVHGVVRGIVGGHVFTNERGTACFEIRQRQSHEKRITAHAASSRPSDQHVRSVDYQQL